MRTSLLLAGVAALGFGGMASAAPVTYPGSQGTITYTTSSTGASNFGNYTRITTQVVYDPATDTYTLKDTGSPTTKSTFGPGNISSSTTNFTTYTKTSGSTTETFRLLNQDPANTLIVLNYVTYGQWRRSTTNTNGTKSVNDTYVVFGQKTSAAAMPRTGSASYSTVLDGTFVNAAGVYAVSGTGSLTANFGSGTIAYDATATGTPEAGGSAISFGTMTGTGSIAYSSSGFKGTGSYNGNGYALDVAGNFYGPAADEIGGNFRIRSSGINRGNGTGAIVGN